MGAAGLFDLRSINGTSVMSVHGHFTSAPPPFTGETLDFEAARVGRIAFDGAGQMYGVYALTFHNVPIPFVVRTRKAVPATYSVPPDGQVVIEADEFDAAESGQPVGPQTASPAHRSVQLACGPMLSSLSENPGGGLQ